MDVGITQLRAELAHWIDHARAGNEVVVTDRGAPVARIVGAPGAPDAPVAAVISSPLARCTATAEAIRVRLAVDGPIRVEPDLIECDFGAWEGLTFAYLVLRRDGRRRAGRFRVVSTPLVSKGRRDLWLCGTFADGADRRKVGRLDRHASPHNAAWSDAVAMRDAAFAAAGAAGLGCEVTEVVERPDDPLILREVTGYITVPNFLDDTATELVRDAGRPAVRGTRRAEFVAIIPRTASAPAPLLVYGHGLFSTRDEVTRDFGTRCLIARRLVERGVRFVQLISGSGDSKDWDHHDDSHAGTLRQCRKVDRPIAGLLADLEARGLLDSTLVVWSGEFGRTPTSQDKAGRDHNPNGFTMWMAGGGIRGGISVGKTDELGNFAVEDRLHVKNLHATVLQQMGLDPNKLTYFYGGLDQKLVGVEGAEPIREVMA